MIFAKFSQDLFCFHRATMSSSEHHVSYCSSLQRWKPDKTQSVQSHPQSGHHNEHAVLPLHMEQAGVVNINQYGGHSCRFHKSDKKIADWYPNIPSLSSHSKVYMKCGLHNCPTACYGSNAR